MKRKIESAIRTVNRAAIKTAAKGINGYVTRDMQKEFIKKNKK